MQVPLSLIQTDLTKIQEGDWFLPMTLKGVNQHEYILIALQQGAVGFVFEEAFRDLVPAAAWEKPHFSVPMLREYLFTLAAEKSYQSKAQVAVIAGSAGKTSVKELVGAILQADVTRESFMSPDNQNTKIALATQVLRLPETCEQAVFEMGARRTGDFKTPLSYLRPTVVALLNIGSAHLGEFGTRENLWHEKVSCLNSPTAETVVVPGDDLRILEFAKGTSKKVISFGRSATHSIQILMEAEDCITLSIEGQVVELDCPFLASAKALNVAAAVGVGLAMNVDLAKIQWALKSFKGVPRRFQKFMWDETPAIDDAFNASPESYGAGLKELQKLTQSKNVLLVMGSILELGSESESAHRQIAHLVQEYFPQNGETRVSVATVGPEATVIGDELLRLGFPERQLSRFSSSEEAKVLQDRKRQYDLVFFKGSKSIQLKRIFEGV